jgi:putative nucleotidyltransferase with HDIG domain
VTESRHQQRSETPPPLTQIPPFPAVAIKALQIVSNDNARVIELSDLICTDAAFSSGILRIVNSPLYGIRKEVTGVLEATFLLGLERIKGLVLTIGTRAYLGDSLEVPAVRACWRHSLACAVIAEDLAGVIQVAGDVSYTAGLIHDIGRLALVVAHPNRYAKFLKSTEKKPCDVLQGERELFGIDHCEAGRSLILSWHLPKDFIAVTAQHHAPANNNKLDVLAIVRLSCMMADTLGFMAVHPLHPRSYEELLNELPEDQRNRLPVDPKELASQIAGKINSIEMS